MKLAYGRIKLDIKTRIVNILPTKMIRSLNNSAKYVGTGTRHIAKTQARLTPLWLEIMFWSMKIAYIDVQN